MSTVEILPQPGATVEIVQATAAAIEVVCLGGTTVEILSTGAQGPQGDAFATRKFAFGDATPDVVATLQPGRFLLTARIDVTEDFDGLGAALSLGKDGQPEAFVPAGASMLSEVAVYEHSVGIEADAPLPISMFLTPGGGASRGRGRITVAIT